LEVTNTAAIFGLLVNVHNMTEIYLFKLFHVCTINSCENSQLMTLMFALHFHDFLYIYHYVLTF